MMYEVEINFNGFVGCSEIYTVEADSEEEAEEEALRQAQDNLELDVLDVREANEDEQEGDSYMYSVIDDNGWVFYTAETLAGARAYIFNRFSDSEVEEMGIHVVNVQKGAQTP